MNKINRSVILLTISDQQHNSLSQYPGVHLDCSFSTGQLWQGSLDKLFPQVIEFDVRASFLAKGFRKTNLELINLVKKYRPEYLVWPAYSDDEIDKESFKKIRELGVIIVGIFFDEGSTFESYSKYWLTSLDYVVSVDANESIKQHRDLGIQAIFEPCCASGLIYTKKRLEYKYPVSFVGSRYGPRKKMVQELSRLGIPVTTFGKGWPGQGYLELKKMVAVFNQSKINLNFTNDGAQLRARMFEVCMSGGFLLTQYCPGLKKLFNIGKEIECFYSIAEAAQKINYYLTHDQERRAIARAGWLKTRKEYSLEAMFTRIFSAIENNKVKRIKLKKMVIDEKIIRQRNLRFGYKHAALAIAGYLEGKKDVWWQEEARLAKSYKASNLMLMLFYFYKLFPKFIAKLVSRGVNRIFTLLRQVDWFQDIIVRSFY